MGNDDALLHRLGTLTLSFAHELRNDVLALRMTAFALSAQQPDDPSVQAVVRTSERMFATLEDLVALARVETAMEHVNLGAVVKSAQSDVAGVTFHNTLPANLFVLGHARLLSRALSVLYKNSITVAEGSVEVHTIAAHGNGSAQIDVIDNGPGIASELEHHIFEPRASTRPGGMGVGLALARLICEAHKGSIVLISGKPHAHFRIEWPAG